ncbi:MAG: UDP-N-acetylmuramate--L-alanine ligase [Actinomycetota bacterium]|nr:UDP-N-acetylmuramate--L-alanine ligase [Actinomycetota bacterium]
MSRPSLESPSRIHIIGIGGAGMSALAVVLHQMGHDVAGSDLRDGPVAERLRGLGIPVHVGHGVANLGDVDLVAMSSAVRPANPELVEARRRGVQVASRAEVLGALSALRRTAAVSGTHGKTTTSSMLALVLVEAGRAPSFVIGGDLGSLGTNATWNDGEWLVVEADESDATFLALDTDLALATNLEVDHLNHYGSFLNLQSAFRRFLGGARQASVLCADDPVLAGLELEPTLTFGFSPEADLRITGLRGGRSDLAFELRQGGEVLGELELAVPGEHNARNAAAAAAAALCLGVPVPETARALARFTGVARRFEFRGEARGVSFVDDYAHLPGEVAATLAAARRGGWRRVVCVFQPHRYSRLAAVGADFGAAFDGADAVVLTSVYPAGEEPLPGISSRVVLDAILAHDPAADVTYVPERAGLVTHLRAVLRPGDCCLTLGAGDLTSLPDELLAEPTW